MPDILGATNPVPGHDRTAINRNVQLPQDNERVQNIPDPNRVTRPDARTEQQDHNLQSDGKVRYDSNYQTFLKRLQSTPDMAESLRRVFAGRESVSVFSGVREGTASEMAELMGMLKMDQAQLAEFLAAQMKAESRFGGALFALLRSAYNQAASQNVRNDILNFLKAFGDFSSLEHLQGNIMRNLSVMANSMPASFAEKLQGMMGELEGLMAAGQNQEAMGLLQKGIFPYMAQYITRSHDMGTAREMLSLLMLDTVRYANSSKEGLLEAFHQLKGYGTLRQQLEPVTDEALLALLERGKVDGSSPAVQFADHLTAAAAKALRGEGGVEMQQAFQEVIRAMLINESVYMPLNHYLLPLEMNGRMLFSELWVDPDADGSRSGGDGKKNNTFKCLFKMDVEALGAVDIVLVSLGNDVDVQVTCSEKAMPFAQKIQEGVDVILRRNALTPVRVSVKKTTRPLSLTEVFPKIFERRDSMNVKA